MQRLVPFLAAWLPSSPPSPGTIFITDPKRPKGEGGSSSAFIRLGMSWRIFCNGDLWKTENPFFFLKKRWISLKSMLELCLKNWDPAEAFAFCPLLFVSPKHSNGFRLSSLQILVSKFDGTFHIHDSHSSNNCGHIPESHRSLNSKHCCDDDPMILPFSEWSSIFHPKKSPGPPCLAWFCRAASKFKYGTFLWD